ncbi:transcription termination factor 1 [Heteronotia binoei]|uniref:transcription termination factor 1 n=1 Tax=Heteronotia binoei TaxID=13085 RepID=UPI002930F1AD|nr:transcription termination factor 1 [Heteronotia binoei]
MTNAAEESSTEDFQISDMVKKKKKKRKGLGQPADAGFCSPLSSDHSSMFSSHFDQATEGGEAPQKKSKKKARQERSDYQLDHSGVTTDSELPSKAGTEVCKPKKKKKRKLGPVEPQNGDWLCVPLSQGKASSQPKADGLENEDWTDGGTPVKKKRTKAFAAQGAEASRVSEGPMKNRTDPGSSGKHKEEMTNTAEESSTEGFQILDMVKKKKKGLGRETHGQPAKAGFCSPLSSDHSSIFSSHFDQASEGGEAPQKKSKKKARQERSDYQLDHSGVTTDSELPDKAGTEVCKPKKKKKRKLGPIEPQNGDWLCVPLSQGKASSQPKTDRLENEDWTDGGTPVKKKRAKAFAAQETEASRLSDGPMKNRTDPGSSGKHKEVSDHNVENSQAELFTSTPLTTQHSSLSQKKTATKLATSTKLSSLTTPGKPHKPKKSSVVEDSESTDVTPRNPHKHKRSSGVEDSDSTDVSSKKPQKHKRSSGVKDSNSTSVTPRKPHKHKKSSGVEDSDSTDVSSKKPQKHKRSSGVKDSNSTSVTPRKPHKHKKSSGIEDADVSSKKPQKHKRSSGVKDSNSTNVTRRKPQKHKKSSGMEDSDSSDVGCEAEETDHEQIKNKSPAKRLEDSSELPKTSKVVRSRLPRLSSKELPASQSCCVEENEFRPCSELVFPDLDAATKELEEFIPHVRRLSPASIKQLVVRDLVRFKNFKQRGIAVKFGKFTKKENDQLIKNVKDFLQLSSIKNAEKLLFVHRFPEERAAITKLKNEHMFGIRIAEGIARPWRLVYYRAKKIFDPTNDNRRYSEKEKRRLLKYQAMYGNHWNKISGLMARSSHSVALKYSQIKSGPNTGRWNKEETKRLIQAVEEILQENCKEFNSAVEEKDEGKVLSVVRENLYKGISWSKVEAKVGTRHWRQCKQKWLSFLTKKMSGGRMMARPPESLWFKINLIERLYEMNIEDANEVDWEALSDIIGDVPPDYIQRRFYRLKATQVPLWNRKTFPEIIDHLYKVTLPKLKSMKAAKAQSTEVKEQRKAFQFQDIFQESSDELIEDSEDEDEDEREQTTENPTGGSEIS